MSIVAQPDDSGKNARCYARCPAAVRDELARLPCASAAGFDATSAWQALMRWLLHFLPGRYARPPARHSEVLGRAQPRHYSREHKD